MAPSAQIGIGVHVNSVFKGALKFQGLLDLYPGATAGYALRLLREKHSGGLLRLRADDSGTHKGEADVLPRFQPDGSKIIEPNSPIEDLDSKAQSRLGVPQGGGDKVLADLVGTGNLDIDGFTSKLYDQSPNLNDVIQLSASSHPILVNSGTVIQKNGQPAIQGTGSAELTASLDVTIATQPFEIFAVVQYNDTNDFTVPVSNFDSSKNRILHYQMNKELRIFAGNVLYKTSFTNTNQILHGGLYNGASSELFLNGSQVATGDAGNIDYKGVTLFSQNAKKGNAFFEGGLQEVIIYDAKKSTNRSDINKTINDHYNIPNF
jgi:hypothetical protein